MQWYRVQDKVPRHGQECAFKFSDDSVEYAIFVKKKYKAVWKFNNRVIDVSFHHCWLPASIYQRDRLLEMNNEDRPKKKPLLNVALTDGFETVYTDSSWSPVPVQSSGAIKVGSVETEKNVDDTSLFEYFILVITCIVIIGLVGYGFLWLILK